MACIFCNPDLPPPQGSKGTILEDRGLFWILLDNHPLAAGHLLIVPKEHVACVGAYSDELMDAFDEELARCLAFVEEHYGRAAWFEHGVLGQTVFHSHVHVLPYDGGVRELVPEGNDAISTVEEARDLRWLYEAQQGYLAVCVGDEVSIVDEELAEPRFFRTRFAEALGAPERADWRNVTDPAELKAMDEEVRALGERWSAFAADGY